MVGAVWPEIVTCTWPERVDRHAGGVARDLQARRHGVAVGGDDRAVRRQAERAVARVGGFAGRQRDLEIAVALDRHVQRVGGLLQVALLVDAVDRRGLHAQPDLRAGRHDGAVVRTVGADAAQVLVDQVLELGPPPLEAGGGHVGDVVGNDFDVGLLGLHPGAGDIERAHRFLPPIRRRRPAAGDRSPAAGGRTRPGRTG